MKEAQGSFWASKKRQEKIVSLILYIIAWTGGLVFVIPLIWMISTSLKMPEDIFTFPPKWIPISNVKADYNTDIRALDGGRVRITPGSAGTRIIHVGESRQEVPAAARINVTQGQVIKRGDILGTLPKEGVLKIERDTGARMFNAYIMDPRGNVIRRFQLPANSKFKIEDGQRVRHGDRIAHVPPQWANYARAWAPEALDETFNRYLMNTIIITVIGIIGVLISSSFVAYGFARFRFPAKNTLFLIMISTMMIPVQVTMIPTFILFKYLGWIDTFAPLIVPTFFGGGAFNIFLMRQFFLTIPYELDDAAKIDGCNYFQIFYIILLPLVKPALATIAIFGFVYNWNDFLNPLIYLNSTSNYTLALGLQTFTTMYGTEYNLMMAASTIVLMPILIMFFFGQRYFIEGVATSGLKG